MRDIVIVGGSIAAVTAADTLRQFGHEGGITVLSAEKHAPYVRPPLSKAVLKGTEAPETVAIAGAGDDWALRLDARAVGVDPERARVRLEDGEEVPYDGLIIASGARARRILADSSESTIRDMDDALGLQSRMASARSMIVVGGGFLGMEVASTAQSLGLSVTVIDMIPHLERQFGPYLAERMTTAARERGVRLLVEPSGVTLVGGDPITGVLTGDGVLHEADIVISAVGDVPNVEWLAGTGWASPAGVLTDRRTRVAPGVVAIGDVAIVPDGVSDTPRRTPHWNAAIDQARVGAAALLTGDEAAPYAPRPYFWTDQWGLDMKICGSIGEGSPEYVEGSWEDGTAVIRFHGEVGPVAAVSVNRRMPIPALRKLAAGV